MPVQTEQQRQATFQAAGQQPAAQAPITPAPQPVTPAAPATALVAPATPQQAVTQTPAQATAQPGVALPATGSVVDLLNSAGQDSSFAAREQLAQKYGIQGYSGSAQQNQELSKKYLEAYNANKGQPVPESGAQARASLDTYFQDSPQQSVVDPVKQFMDSYAGMNPIEANLFQQLSGLASSTTNQQSLTDFYKQEVASQGIPELNLQLADINRIMQGTEDDIRDEVTNAGGFATESQIQALTGARNKNLLKQATYLSDTLNAKNDYIDRIVSLTQADRKQVSEDLDRKLGITKTLIDMSQQMTNSAKENYQNIIDTVGWGGLAESVKNSPEQAAKIEKLMGLSPGELQALGKYKKPLTEEEQLRNQNLRLQNQKITQDLNTGPSVSTQVVDVGGKKVLINSKTGQVISDITANFAPDRGAQVAQDQQSILDTSTLLGDPALKSAVGPNAAARFSPTSLFTGAKSNFIAGVQQLTNQLTLDNLGKAKANGATFGALSEGELGLVSSSASKLNSWAIKDKNGNVVGYDANEKDFKGELDKINNFKKLDYILKGGNPESVGVQEMADGTFWTKNSDGTYTKIQ